MQFRLIHRPCCRALLVVALAGCAADSPDVAAQQQGLGGVIAEADPELCPAGSLDSDSDRLCDVAEIRLGTDIGNPDSDGDSLSDGLEVSGYTLNGKLLDMKALGADPLHKDVFVYIDYLAAFQPTSAAIQRVKDAFAVAPVTNPDKTPGITLHVEVSPQPLPAAEAVLAENILTLEQLLGIKDLHFDQLKSIAYHYAFFGKQYASDTSSGLSLGIPATDFMVTLGAFATQDVEEWTTVQAGTLMHELGHNLGLHHGGLSESGVDDSLYKPNYFSIMNYNYQLVGIPRDQTRVLDYGRVSVGAVEEQSLYEASAFPGAGATTAADLAHYDSPLICVKRKINRRREIDTCLSWKPLLGDAGTGLDFNRDRRIDRTRIRRTADLDAAQGRFSRFTAVIDDWTHLTFNGDRVIGVENAPKRRDIAELHPTTCMRTDTETSTDDELTDNTEPTPDMDETDPTTPEPPTAPEPPEMEPQTPSEPDPSMDPGSSTEPTTPPGMDPGTPADDEPEIDPATPPELDPMTPPIDDPKQPQGLRHDAQDAR